MSTTTIAERAVANLDRWLEGRKRDETWHEGYEAGLTEARDEHEELTNETNRTYANWLLREAERQEGLMAAATDPTTKALHEGCAAGFRMAWERAL